MTARGLILVDSPTTGPPPEAAGLQMPRISEKAAYLITCHIRPERRAPTLTLNTLPGSTEALSQAVGQQLPSLQPPSAFLQFTSVP